MIVGHTKFTPDSCFGLLKQKFRKSQVNTLQQLKTVVETSASCNEVEMVGWEDGISIIPTYDWSTYLGEGMLKVKGIKKYQHFHFHASGKGTVSCQIVSDSAAKEITLLRNTSSWTVSSSILPDQIQPKGLDPNRQWYLYDKIRPFCEDENNKNKTCPLPTCPKPSNIRNTPEPSTQSPISSPPTKRSKICGKCGTIGHNSRTCNH